MAPENELLLVSQGEGAYLLSGSLDFSNVPGLVASSRHIFPGHGAIEIDLTGVERSDSAGLALLIEWMREARRHRRQLRYRNLPRQMASMVQASGLEGVLPL